jgi:hypothetical protein
MRLSGRRLSSIVVLLALAALAPPASASNTWSDTDPIVLITTPGGHQVAVYVDNGTSPADHLASAQVAKMSYTVKSVASGTTTDVTLTSTVPCDGLGPSYATRAIVSSGAFATGTVYGQDYGTCGQPMSVGFKLDVS